MLDGKRRYPGLWARRRDAIWQAPRPKKRFWPRPTRRRMVAACLTLVCLAVWPTAGVARSYRVKKGDVLSAIAHRFLHGEVWGPHGTLGSILALNRDIKNPNFIVPGELIQVPGEDEACIATAAAPPTPCPIVAPCPVLPEMPTAPHEAPSAVPQQAPTSPNATPAPLPQEAPADPNAGLVPVPVQQQGPSDPNLVPWLLKPPASTSATPCPLQAEATPCDCNKQAPELIAPPQGGSTPQPNSAPLEQPVENSNIVMGPVADANQAPAPQILLGYRARHLELHVSPYYRFTQLNAEVYADRSDASLESKLNTGISAGLSVDLVHRLSLSVDLQIGTIYFASPSTVALSSGAAFEYGAAVTLEWQVVPRLSLLGGFTYGNEPFSTADATLVLDIQMVSMPGVTAGLSLTALRFTQQSFGVDISAAYKFNVHTPQFQVRDGNVFFAGIFWRYMQDNRTRWRARLGFGQRRQDTSLISQTDNALGVEASYVWPID